MHPTADSAELELLSWLANVHIQKVPAVGRPERSQPLLLGNREDGFGKLRMPEQTIHLRRLITCEVIQIRERVSYFGRTSFAVCEGRQVHTRANLVRRGNKKNVCESCAGGQRVALRMRAIVIIQLRSRWVRRRM